MTSIYSLFRQIIGDETYGDYKVPDTSVLIYLDKAIDQLSLMHDNYVEEEVTVTAENVTNGYFTLTNDIVEIVNGLPNENYYWKYGRNNKIVILRNDFPIGEYDIRYKAKYKKFDGQVRDDDYFDFDQDADLPIVLYAVGLWLQTQAIQKANGNGGVISSKQEENQRIDYAVNGELISASSPANLMDQAIEMMRNMSSAQNAFFSVRN